MPNKNKNKPIRAGGIPSNPREWYDQGWKVRILKDRLQYYKEGLSRDASFHALAWTGIGHTLNRIKDGLYSPKARVVISPDVLNAQFYEILDKALAATGVEFKAWVESNVPMVDSPPYAEQPDYLRTRLLVHFTAKGSSVSFGYSLLPGLIRPFNEDSQAPSFRFFDNAILYAGSRVEHNIREYGKDNPTIMNLLLGKIEVNHMPSFEYDEEQVLKHVVEMEPELVEAWVGLGYVLRSRGHNAEATNAFKMAIKLDPKNKNARQELGDERPRKRSNIWTCSISITEHNTFPFL